MSKLVPFSDLFDIPLRNGVTKPKKIRGEGYKMVNMGELFANPIIDNIQMDRVPLTETEKNSLLKPKDLLFARQSLIRSGAGQCSIFMDDAEDVCFESHIIRCRLHKDKANPLFYFYLFKSNYGREIMDPIIEQGAGASGIRGSDLSKLQVPYVELDKQNFIAEQLYDLDRKIQLNTQINQILEQIAQTIFKSWFIDFDPVHAKANALASGQTLEQATQAAMAVISGKNTQELHRLQTANPEQYQQLWEIAEAFPSGFDEDGVPRGWESKKVGEVVETVGGATPSTKNEDFWLDGDISWTTPKDLSSLKSKVLLKTERKITQQGLRKISSGLLDIDTVLMSSRAPVGYLALVKTPVAINQGYIAIKKQDLLNPYYMLFWCVFNMEEIKNRSSGTTFAEISKSSFREIPIIVPSRSIVDYFRDKVSSLYDLITKNEQEVSLLGNIRDELLPKLLSGEV